MLPGIFNIQSMNAYKHSYIPFAVAAMLFMILLSCDDDPRFSGPDYSEAPPPFDTTEAIRTISADDGLRIHIIEEGGGLDTVIYRDVISVRYTGRKQDGEIFESTYRNGSDAPRTLLNLTPEPKNVNGNPVSPLVDGFRRGLLGMVKGEKRTIVVPPSLGYGDTRQGQNGFNLRNDTLVFDVELVNIQQ